GKIICSNAYSFHRLSTVSVGANNFTNANVSINFTTAPAAEFVAYQLRGNPFNGVNALNAGTNTSSCYWIVRQFGAGSVAYSQMNFTLPASNTISTTDQSNPSNLKLYKRPDNSTAAFGASIANASSANNGTKLIQFTGLTETSFSQFEIGSTSSPLPITLLEFRGERRESSKVLLEWKTATELNNKGFEIETSENGLLFTKIAFVDGAGNSNIIKNYSLNIQNNNDTYYRLKQIDFNGEFSYSNIIFIKGSEHIVSIYPNPSNEIINIKTSKEGFVYEIFTLQGNSLIKNNEISNVTTVNIKSLPKGIYFVHIIQNNKRVVRKIVVE
ncbi:MAG: T9SS C-terminal target domain-containing protein, partial [Bacteroidetes bacterium]